MTQLDPGTVRSILDGVAIGVAHWAEVHNPTIAKGDLSLEREVHATAGCWLVQMHVLDWVKAQREDPMLSPVSDWLKAQKKTDLKAFLVEHASSEEGWLILQNQQNFMIHQGALYLCSMPKDLLLFVVPKAHWVTTWMGAIEMQVFKATIISCHCYGSASGGWEWSTRCNNPSSPLCIACNMRDICPKCLYTQ